MKTIDEQRERYEVLWQQHSLHFGEAIFEDDPIPIYTIGVPLNVSCHASMQILQEELKKSIPAEKGWLAPERQHITLHLPGRLGKHFQKEDIQKMESSLRDICKNFKPFTVSLGNINCFPNVLYREVYDAEGKLYELHEKIIAAIPYAENPQFIGKNFLPHMSLLYLKEKMNNPFLGSDVNRMAPELAMNVSELYLAVSTDEQDEILARFEL